MILPRTSHHDFNVQMQMSEAKGFPQILHGMNQDKNQRSISLEPGYEYEIELNPYGQISSQDFREMSLEKRGCRLSHETMEKSTYPFYTKDNCLYDCRVQQAFKICQCVPWDFENAISESTECDIFGRTCFFNVMENMTHSRDEFCYHCIEECDWIKYRRRIIGSESISLKGLKEEIDKLLFPEEYDGKYCCKYFCIDSRLR